MMNQQMQKRHIPSMEQQTYRQAASFKARGTFSVSAKLGIFLPFSIPYRKASRKKHKGSRKTSIHKKHDTQMEDPMDTHIWSRRIVSGRRKDNLLSVSNHVPFDGTLCALQFSYNRGCVNLCVTFGLPCSGGWKKVGGLRALWKLKTLPGL